MRWSIVVALAGCASSTGPLHHASRIHNVTCAGVRVTVPSSLRVVQVTSNELIAASRDVALAVFEDGPVRTGTQMRVIEEVGDRERPIYRVALRDADRCTFRAVALSPPSADGLAIMNAVAGTSEPNRTFEGARARKENALSVLLRMVEGHL